MMLFDWILLNIGTETNFGNKNNTDNKRRTGLKNIDYLWPIAMTCSTAQEPTALALALV